MADQSVSASGENSRLFNGIGEEWDDLSAPAERKGYWEPQLDKDARYFGPLSDMPVEQARKLLAGLADYFGLGGFDGMPLPPKGLPGTPAGTYDQSSPAWELLSIGWDYFVASARSQPRAMHNQWAAAKALLRQTRDAERKRIEEAEIATSMALGKKLEQERGGLRQLVYFIGSESGPIKIGMAVHPEVRRKELQTAHHEKLTVLATRTGGQPQERAYHKQFSTHRLHGEWFERHPDILAEIERINQETPHAR